MLWLFCAPIKLSVRFVPWFGHLSRELSAISGLGGRFGRIFCPIDTRLD